MNPDHTHHNPEHRNGVVGTLREAVRDCLTVQSLAQVILSVCPPGARYSELVTAAVGTDWPDRVEDAAAVTLHATNINLRTDTKGHADGLLGSRGGERAEDGRARHRRDGEGNLRPGVKQLLHDPGGRSRLGGRAEGRAGEP